MKGANTMTQNNMFTRKQRWQLKKEIAKYLPIKPKDVMLVQATLKGDHGNCESWIVQSENTAPDELFEIEVVVFKDRRKSLLFCERWESEAEALVS